MWGLLGAGHRALRPPRYLISLLLTAFMDGETWGLTAKVLQLETAKWIQTQNA